MKRLLRQPSALAAAAIVAAFIAVAVGAPRLAPYDPIATSYTAVRTAPSPVHRLGTDEVGRDVLSRVIWGARGSLSPA